MYAFLYLITGGAAIVATARGKTILFNKYLSFPFFSVPSLPFPFLLILFLIPPFFYLVALLHFKTVCVSEVELKLDGKITDLSGGVYRVEYILQAASDYTLDIGIKTFSGIVEPIHGEPIFVSVYPGKLYSPPFSPFALVIY